MRRAFPLLVFGLFPLGMVGQGCSDAGVCTAGPMGQMAISVDSTGTDGPRHYAKLQIGGALGEQMVFIVQTQAEVGIGITKRLMFRLSVPYIVAVGDLGGNHGVGDMIPTLSYTFLNKPGQALSGFLGLRMPTGKSGDEDIARATFSPTSHQLPMPYQTGLGSLDLLFGAQYRHKNWTVALAYQHVLQQNNQNAFMHQYWLDQPAAMEYFESFALERADDVVARFQRSFAAGKFIVQPGLLAIMHLGKDTRMEQVGIGGMLGQPVLDRRAIEGSDGLTLNVTVEARSMLSRHWSLELGIAAPVIARAVRPDGLTRSAILQIGMRRWF